MDKTELEALLAKIDIWLLVFGIVVVVGVAGESFFGIRHWWNSRKLQVLQEKENADRGAEIILLNKGIEDAKQATAEALKQAAEANKKAEEERLARVKIEGKLAPRRITTEQANKLAADVAPLKGKTISFFFTAGTTEIEAFARRLADILTSGGVTVRMSPGMLLGHIEPGFSLMVNKTRMAEASILAKALLDAGLASRNIPAQESRIPDELTLTIGPKD